MSTVRSFQDLIAADRFCSRSAPKPEEKALAPSGLSVDGEWN